MKQLIIFLSLFLIVGCDKPRKPVAKIDVSKTSLVVNESVSLKASGSKYDHVEWTLPDGGKSTSTYITFSADEVGQYPIKLTAWSEKEGFKDEDEVIMNVAEADPGQLMVWTPNPNIVGFSILIDGVNQGVITAFYPNGIGSNPCGSGGCVTSELSAGNHTVTATNGSVTFNGSVNVSSNSCTKFYVN